MKYFGEFIAAHSPFEVGELLSDPVFLARCFPDYQDVHVEDQAHFTVALAVSFGAMNGVLELHLERTELILGQRVAYAGKGTAARNDIVFELSFDLVPLDQGTQVKWSGVFSVEGMLATFVSPMVDELGARNLRQLVANLSLALRPGSDSAHIDL